MKKFLPKTSGFTLVELLVVIAILAVLAVVGLAIFSGLTGKGNDSRRSADIKAFADAMEVKRANSTGSVYITVVATDFATGTFPKEPTSRAEKYCYQDSTTTPVANTTLLSWATVASGCPTGWNNVDGAAPTVTANATYFKFCTVNEKNQAAGGAVICQGSKQ